MFLPVTLYYKQLGIDCKALMQSTVSEGLMRSILASRVLFTTRACLWALVMHVDMEASQWIWGLMFTFELRWQRQ